jgi:hypothetical protein
MSFVEWPVKKINNHAARIVKGVQVRQVLATVEIGAAYGITKVEA